MADAFAIVVDDVTAGIVVRHEREKGFRFYASERRFYPIDGKIFRNPRAAIRSAGRLLVRDAEGAWGRAA
ncbi:MAG: hypothetical protein IT561_00690 [Alphaproteobacteria bacterium]|nr:hypothetical protein [Alphaproteobacteria bacterium]